MISHPSESHRHPFSKETCNTGTQVRIKRPTFEHETVAGRQCRERSNTGFSVATRQHRPADTCICGKQRPHRADRPKAYNRQSKPKYPCLRVLSHELQQLQQRGPLRTVLQKQYGEERQEKRHQTLTVSPGNPLRLTRHVHSLLRCLPPC